MENGVAVTTLQRVGEFSTLSHVICANCAYCEHIVSLIILLAQQFCFLTSSCAVTT